MIIFNGAIVLLLMILNAYRHQLGDVLTMLVGGLIYVSILLVVNFKFSLNSDFNLLLVKIGRQLKILEPSS
jgi:hypothetical protein